MLNLAARLTKLIHYTPCECLPAIISLCCPSCRVYQSPEVVSCVPRRVRLAPSEH